MVAEEISKLADQTRNSIKDIVNLIDNTTKAVGLGAEKFQESLSIVKELTDYIGEVNSSATIVTASLFAQAEKLSEIRKNTDQVNQLGETVSESSGFQKRPPMKFLYRCKTSPIAPNRSPDLRKK